MSRHLDIHGHFDNIDDYWLGKAARLLELFIEFSGQRFILTGEVICRASRHSRILEESSVIDLFRLIEAEYSPVALMTQPRTPYNSSAACVPVLDTLSLYSFYATMLLSATKAVSGAYICLLFSSWPPLPIARIFTLFTTAFFANY